MHPRVSLHQVAMLDEPSAAFIDHCNAIGVPQMTLAMPMLAQPGDLDAARTALAAGPARCHTVNHPVAMGSNLERASPEAETAALLAAIDTAASLGAPNIYMVSGGRGSLLWEAAAERFAAIIAPCIQPARDKGVRLLVETASDFNVDIHLAHTLDDTALLAEIAGIDVCIELAACWFEAGLREKFRRIVPKAGLVQVCDYVSGDRTAPCRAVPGDGMVPNEWLLGELLDAGYTGVFDLELLGPRIAAEGPREATRRAAQNLADLLDKLGA